MIRMTLPEFYEALKAQQSERVRRTMEAPDRKDLAFVCPMCGTVQTARDLMTAGGFETFKDVAKMIGFSCIGRLTGAGSPRKESDGKPCNWTLGGFFLAHKLEIIDADGKAHPHFEIATADQIAAHSTGAEDKG